jgi:pimeloyl-ACP methyl ester carboxylesterase
VTREMLPIARGRYAKAVLQVPTTLLLGARDPVTLGLGTRAGPVRGQPQLHVEVLDGVGHWVPEQRPQAVIDWVLRAGCGPDATGAGPTVSVSA